MSDVAQRLDQIGLGKYTEVIDTQDLELFIGRIECLEIV